MYIYLCKKTYFIQVILKTRCYGTSEGLNNKHISTNIINIAKERSSYTTFTQKKYNYDDKTFFCLFSFTLCIIYSKVGIGNLVPRNIDLRSFHLIWRSNPQASFSNQTVPLCNDGFYKEILEIIIYKRSQ